jgi:imidazolonepropionase-like amidohydrolase
MSTTVLLNGKIVTGDGKTLIETGSVVIDGDRIQDVLAGTRDEKAFSGSRRIIQAEGLLVMPGVINHHTHGIVRGPLYPSGATPLDWDHITANLDKHLLQGTTTLMSVCGFADMEEVVEANRRHPIRIKTATSHTPKNFEAAKQTDGAGLTGKHLSLTVEKMLDQGAVAIGEIGAGHTLGGGGQDYLYIPRAVEKETGKRLTTPQARKLKYAILGRKIDRSAFDPESVREVIDELGLSRELDVQRAREIVEQSVLPSYEVGLEGMREAAEIGKTLKVPVLIHNAASSMRVVEEVCRGKADIIAGHSSHPTFEMEESVTLAKRIKALGKTVDVSTLDMFGARQMCDSADILLALIREGVVDTISTDYAGGLWDSILTAVESAVADGAASLPEAVAMTGSNVCRAIPLLAPDRGLIEKGKFADILILNPEKISEVRTAIIDGRVVVDDGRIV